MPTRKLTDAQRVMRYFMQADLPEARLTLDNMRMVVALREAAAHGGRVPRVGRTRKVTIPPNEPEA